VKWTHPLGQPRTAANLGPTYPGGIGEADLREQLASPRQQLVKSDRAPDERRVMEARYRSQAALDPRCTPRRRLPSVGHAPPGEQVSAFI
jgi:hypothetical protein